MSKKNIHIGVDLGTTSIGLSVIDDQCNVIYKPQIIHFPDISDEKTGNCYNKNRRSHRLYRRQLSRYKYRLKCFKNLIMEHFSLDDNQYLCDINETFKGENLYETRKELLEKNIPCENKTKFIKMLYLYLKHRGSYHVIDQFDVKNFPSNRIFCDEKLRFNDISHNDWKKEVELFLKLNNKEHCLNNKDHLANDAFIDRYLKIFDFHRDYRYGPGDKYNHSPYGVEWIDQGIPKDVLWEKNIGHCSFYPDEKRIIKSSTSFEIYNLLAKLCNVRFDKNKPNIQNNCLNTQFKVEFINSLINENKLMEFSDFKKLIKKIHHDVDIEFLNIDKNMYKNGFNFTHTCFFSKNLKSPIIDEEEKLISKNIDFLDQVAETISKNITENSFIKEKIKDDKKKGKDKEKLIDLTNDAKEQLKKTLPNEIELTKETIDHLLSSYKYYAKFSRVSKKACNEINPSLLANDGYNPNNKFVIHPLTTEQILENINVPSVKNAVNKFCIFFKEYINLINRDSSNNIKSINIELTRSKNSADEVKNINKMISFNADVNTKNIEIIKSLGCQVNKKLILACRLYDEQNGEDPYDLEINLGTKKEMIKNFKSEYEIDHIFCLSWSADDNFNNKVLTRKIHNQNKNNKTPYEYLRDQNWKDHREHWEKIYNSKSKDVKKNQRKLKSLACEDDNHSRIAVEFCGRNLSDTGYISKCVLNIVRNDFGSDNIKINIVNGKFTRMIHKSFKIDKDKWDLPKAENKADEIKKNRDIFNHHGIDATAIAVRGLISQHLQNWLNYDDEMNEKKYEKGIEYEKLMKSINDSNLSSYLSNYNNYHFYYPKFNHTGLDFYNETLYSGIKKDGKITQYNKLKILKMKNTDLENYFGDSSRNHDNLLIYKSDKKLYMELNNIFNENSKDKKINAFVRYMQEKYPIRKDFIEVEKNQATGYNPGKISKKIYSLKYTKTINANVFEKKPSSKSIKNRISFYASLKPKKIMHYLGYDKNKKEIHVCIPINIYFSKFTKNKLGIRIFKLNYKNIYEELKLYKKIVYFKNKSDQFEKVMIINENNGDDDTNYMKYCNNLFVERICFGEKYELKKEYKNTTIAGISSCSNIFYVDGISNNKIEIKAIDRIKVIDRIIIRHQIIANTFFMKFEKIRVYHHICI